MLTTEDFPQDGDEVRPGVFLIGELTPVVGTNKLRGLVNCKNMLCVAEFTLLFKKPNAVAQIGGESE